MKIKIFSGFISIVIILALAAIYSIIEFSKISGSVNALLDNNYKTIKSANNMVEGVERIDNGVLLLLIGEFDQGRSSISSGDSLFNANLHIVQNNLTEKNEDKYLDSISHSFATLKGIIKYPIVGTNKQGNIDWYNSDFHPHFKKLKYYINELTNLNQNSMYTESIHLKEKSTRAITPAIVSIFAGIIFTMFFNFLINYYYLSPLKRINEKLPKLRSPSDYRLEENAMDELKTLDENIREAINKSKF